MGMIFLLMIWFGIVPVSARRQLVKRFVDWVHVVGPRLDVAAHSVNPALTMAASLAVVGAIEAFQHPEDAVIHLKEAAQNLEEYFSMGEEIAEAVESVA